MDSFKAMHYNHPTMNQNLLIGIWRISFAAPKRLWQGQITENARQAAAGLGFMTPDHQRVRDFVTLEIPRTARPVPPERISRELRLPLERVKAILDELERRMTFIYRNPQGEVTWAYPVTTEPTPHRITLSSGEQFYAA